MRAVDTAGTKGVETGEQAGLVVVIVADTAGEGVPGPAARHARCAIVANPVDRRARTRHRRRCSAHPDSPRRSRARGQYAPFTSLHDTAPCPILVHTPLRKRTEAISRDIARM